MLRTMLLSLDLLDMAEKREETETVPSFEAVHTPHPCFLPSFRDEHIVQKVKKRDELRLFVVL